MRRFSLLSALLLYCSAMQAQPYIPYNCSPTGAPVYPNSCSDGYYITRVSTTGGTLNINNSSACGNTASNYSYYTGPGKLIQVNAGSTVNFKFEFTGTAILQRLVFWIDWNQDGLFNNSYYNVATNPTGEIVNTTTASGTSIATVINPFAKHGLTRMRVRTFSKAASGAPPDFQTPTMSASGVVEPCQTISPVVSGETEDYDIMIDNPCVAIPAITFANTDSKGTDVTWVPKGNEVLFEYLVDKNPNPPGTGNNLVPNTTTSLHIDLECNTTYYFHIRGVCDNSASSQSLWYYGPWRTETITTPPCCDKPNLKVSDVGSYTAMANWGPVTSVQKYEYMIRMDTIVPTKGTLTTSSSVFLNGLQCSRQYYFFLRALCSPTPQSDWIIDSFLTQPCLSVDNTPVLPPFRLNVYPNPVKDVLMVSVMHGMRTGKADIMVTDMTGKLVGSTVMEGDRAELNTGSLPRGLYVLKYQDEANSYIVKINKE